MPLIHSGSKAALKENMRMLHSEIGKSPHVQSQRQAVAIALSNARRYGKKFASGGLTMPWTERLEAYRLGREGFLNSSVPGRTDKLPITVKGGSYIVPADHLAAIGEGNSLAGADILNKIFKMGPYDTAPSNVRPIRPNIPKLPAMRSPGFARGGDTSPTDIVAAGGEFAIPPHKIEQKFGSLKKGHDALDRWIVETRKKHAKTLSKLPGPKKS